VLDSTWAARRKSLVPAPVVVLFTTYPIAQPRSGGQIRAAALAQAYVAGGFRVVPIAVTEAGAFPRLEHGPDDLEFPLDDPRAFDGGAPLPQSNDLQAGRFLAADEKRFKHLVKKLPTRVEAFHLEQPWLLPAVMKLKALPRFERSLVVYGSQNIEAPLRAAICQQLGIDGERVVAAVRALEIEACRAADLTLAVSESDESTLRVMGARRVLRAANGIHTSTATPKVVARWLERLKYRRVALFVGSAHPPNASGFIQAFGDALGFLPPDCCIVAAGRVGGRLREHYDAARNAALNRSRLVITGEVEEDDLAALKALAEIYLLPIFDGGGSNIKTSEAILSGRPIIATSVSLRGFERYTTLPGLTVADTRDRFVDALRKAFTAPSRPTATIDTRRTELLWQNTLAQVAPTLTQLLSSRG
jgi:glycosyltransferase involved in cell wall biosynthesis